jgi:competence ComEA-like helix-hairpin-helix protein
MDEWESRAIEALEHRNRTWVWLTVVSWGLAFSWLGWNAWKFEVPSSLPAEFVVDLNRATAAELHLLPGLGPKSVQAILSYRDQHGGFTRVEELTTIPGIKEGKLRALLPYITVDPRHAQP